MNTRDHSEIGVKVRHKRVITEARKRQNRIASRVYRQKKSASVGGKKSQPANPAVASKRKLVPKPSNSTSPVMELSSLESNLIDDQISTASRLDEGCQPLEVIQHTPESQTEILNYNDILALLSCSYAFLAAMNPTGCSVSLVPEDITSVSSCLDGTGELGIANTTSSLTSLGSDPSVFLSPRVTNFQAPEYAMPDPYLNNLRSPHLSLLTAILYNSRSLNIKLESVMTPYFDSPFYRSTLPSDNPNSLLASAQNPFFPAHLQPTLPQILFPHHAFLDLIPFPVLRARAIAWAATTPAILSVVDLKRDIVDDGLRCWHEIGTGAGNGQPWDMRSWEFTPWFLEKWRMLIFS